LSTAERVSALEQLLARIKKNASLPRQALVRAPALPARPAAKPEAIAAPPARERVELPAKPALHEPDVPTRPIGINPHALFAAAEPPKPAAAAPKPAAEAPKPAAEAPVGLEIDVDVEEFDTLIRGTVNEVISAAEKEAARSAEEQRRLQKITADAARIVEEKRLASERATAEKRAAEEKRAEEKRAEEKRAEEKRAEEKRAEEKRAEEKRAEEKRAEDERRARAEQERLAAVKRAEEERIARAEQERIAAEKRAEEERIAAEKRAEEERIARAEQERIAAEKRAEEERIAAAKRAEEERVARAEQERIAAEKRAEEERVARAEQERIAAEKRAEQERIAAEKRAEEERIAAEDRAEEERLAREAARISRPGTEILPISSRLPKDASRPIDDALGDIEEDPLVQSGEVASQRQPTGHEAPRVADVAALGAWGDDQELGVPPPPAVPRRDTMRSVDSEPNEMPAIAGLSLPESLLSPMVEVKIVADPPPSPVPNREPAGRVPPMAVEITADSVQRMEQGPANAAQFLGAVREFRPVTFGDLLDASLSLGSGGSR
jgi:hypothetical protein